jgi:hypothetical protein
VGIYKSNTEFPNFHIHVTRPRSFISGNICFEFSAQCLCSVRVHSEKTVKERGNGGIHYGCVICHREGFKAHFNAVKKGLAFITSFLFHSCMGFNPTTGHRTALSLQLYRIQIQSNIPVQFVSYVSVL